LPSYSGDLNLYILADDLTQDQLQNLSYKLTEIDLKKLNPKFTAHDVICRVIKDEDIYEEPQAATKEFRAGLERVQKRM
jgi:hypothetical protein